ncbi:hypothetical protein LTR78_006499 [Recurvomyces mirabilis]|uniref:Spindle pole body-associated protein cut12 domain-containing protein n=2 Tax=Recurvomyces mirabilis TaxID=574656 RepID=A0AAE0WKW4_9PEZI|nr:hypothetical protein LTR78_006499 [Recurvomyces mirabilis]
MVNMLHWLAGQKLPEEATDPGTTGYVDPPETPAPVFAVRAFKHAIFGTPQTVQQPKVRRHSSTEHTRTRAHTRPERPQLTRPKSAGDARLLEEAAAPEAVSSPTKGILMTPGTAAAKKKNVTFGDHVLDNEEKRPSKSGLPEEYPGKFPSPWTKPIGSDDDLSDVPDRIEKTKGRSSKLTEALEQARDESGKRTRTHRRNKSVDESDMTKDMLEPVSDSGKYWKVQYDSYRENSQREIRKLITKQKAAKTFARDKDTQCIELADELRQERKKVEKLEKRTAELERRLKAMQQELEQASARPAAESIVQVESAAPSKIKEGHLAPKASAQHTSQPLVPAAKTTIEQLALPTTSDVPVLAMSKHEIAAKADPEPVKSRTRTRPTTSRTKTDDDIWNQSLQSSGLARSRSPERSKASCKPGRSITSGTEVTPLQSLSINTLPSASLLRRDSVQPSPPMDQFAKEPLVRQEVIWPREAAEKPKTSPALAAGLPTAPAPNVDEVPARSRSPIRTKTTTVDLTSDLTMPPLASSPFQPSPMLSPPGVDVKKSTYFDPKAQPLPTTTGATTKDDESPASKTRPALAENIKPTAAWNAINAPGAGMRLSSLTDKSGRELNQDRIAAARARIAAKGRGPS